MIEAPRSGDTGRKPQPQYSHLRGGCHSKLRGAAGGAILSTTSPAAPGGGSAAGETTASFGYCGLVFQRSDRHGQPSRGDKTPLELFRGIAELGPQRRRAAQRGPTRRIVRASLHPPFARAESDGPSTLKRPDVRSITASEARRDRATSHVPFPTPSGRTLTIPSGVCRRSSAQRSGAVSTITPPSIHAPHRSAEPGTPPTQRLESISTPGV